MTFVRVVLVTVRGGDGGSLDRSKEGENVRGPNIRCLNMSLAVKGRWAVRLKISPGLRS